MKLFFASALAMMSLASPLQAASASELGQKLCNFVDGYRPGSLHYFDCLNHLEKMPSGLSQDQVVAYVCDAVSSFWNLDESLVERCYEDASTLLP